MGTGRSPEDEAHTRSQKEAEASRQMDIAAGSQQAHSSSLGIATGAAGRQRQA